MSIIVDQDKTKQMNLGVIKRSDAAVEDILATASHVTLYEFDVDKKAWSRKDVEGSLFVVKRTAQPRFQFIVMNRRSPENLVEDLLGDFEYDVQIPYLLYRNSLKEVNGIWFYHKQECETIAKLFGRILTAYGKHPPNPPVFKPAREEFSELERPLSEEVEPASLEPEVIPASAVVFKQGGVNSLEALFSSALQVNSQQTPPVAASHPGPALPAVSHVAMNASVPAPISMSALFSAPAASAVSVQTRSSSGLLQEESMALLTPAYFQPMVDDLSAPACPPPQSSGAPLLQPFPPPSPPLSLASASSPALLVTQESLRAALLQVVQDDKFMDLLLEKLQNCQGTQP